jgi:2-oxoglutarate dehydrogenase E2 component (dihydrolipoamide succinyltransferase)
MLTTFNEADMSAVMKLRGEMQMRSPRSTDQTRLHVVLHQSRGECAESSAAVNGRMDGDDFVQNHYYRTSVWLSARNGG